MTKEVKEIKGIKVRSFNLRKVTSYAFYGALAVGAGLMMSEIALGFDLDKGFTESESVIIKVLKKHWGKAVGIVGITAALVGEGEKEQRAKNALKWAGGASALIMGIFAATD